MYCIVFSASFVIIVVTLVVDDDTITDDHPMSIIRITIIILLCLNILEFLLSTCPILPLIPLCLDVSKPPAPTARRTARPWQPRWDRHRVGFGSNKHPLQGPPYFLHLSIRMQLNHGVICFIPFVLKHGQLWMFLEALLEKAGAGSA